MEYAVEDPVIGGNLIASREQRDAAEPVHLVTFVRVGGCNSTSEPQTALWGHGDALVAQCRREPDGNVGEDLPG